MAGFGSAYTQAFTYLLKPFEGGRGLGGIVFVSVLTGAVMLFLFKATSDQKAMKRVKTRISAYFLEMRLYSEQMASVVASQRRILRANLSYMRLAAVPAAVMILPVVLVMIQVSLRYSHSSLVPGDTAIVKIKLEEGRDPVSEHLTLSPGEGAEKASPAVRIPALGEVDWKIRLTQSGVRRMVLTAESGEMSIPVFAATNLAPLYCRFTKSSFWESLLNPGAPKIPESMPLASIEISYPEKKFSFGLFDLPWLWTFLVISMASGVILKFIFRVE